MRSSDGGGDTKQRCGGTEVAVDWREYGCDHTGARVNRKKGTSMIHASLFLVSDSSHLIAFSLSLSLSLLSLKGLM